MIDQSNIWSELSHSLPCCFFPLWLLLWSWWKLWFDVWNGCHPLQPPQSSSGLRLEPWNRSQSLLGRLDLWSVSFGQCLSLLFLEPWRQSSTLAPPFKGCIRFFKGVRCKKEWLQRRKDSPLVRWVFLWWRTPWMKKMLHKRTRKLPPKPVAEFSVFDGCCRRIILTCSSNLKQPLPL